MGMYGMPRRLEKRLNTGSQMVEVEFSQPPSTSYLHYIYIYIYTLLIPLKPPFWLVNCQGFFWCASKSHHQQVMDANRFKDVTLGSCELDLRSIQQVRQPRRFRQDWSEDTVYKPPKKIE